MTISQPQTKQKGNTMRNIKIQTNTRNEKNLPTSQSLYQAGKHHHPYIGNITQTRPDVWRFAPTKEWASKCPAGMAKTRDEIVRCINHQLNSNIQ